MSFIAGFHSLSAPPAFSDPDVRRQANLSGETTIQFTVMMTVMISIFCHGLSALPGISCDAGRIARLDSAAPERQGHCAEKTTG